MEYKITVLKIKAGLLGVTAREKESAEKFALEVSQQIALGWEPQEGVGVGCASDGGTRLFQAMTKRR